MAEREGFEPPIPVKVCPLSRRIVSTAHAPLRVKNSRRLSVFSSASLVLSRWQSPHVVRRSGRRHAELQFEICHACSEQLNSRPTSNRYLSLAPEKRLQQ